MHATDGHAPLAFVPDMDVDPQGAGARDGWRLRSAGPGQRLALPVREADQACHEIRGVRRDERRRRIGRFSAMLDDMPTTSELLEFWRDASRAAQLARRLTEIAEEAVVRAETEATGAEEIAALAEATAASAETAAARARAAADRLRAVADDAKGSGRSEATAALAQAVKDEDDARDHYHVAEREARARLDGKDR